MWPDIALAGDKKPAIQFHWRETRSMYNLCLCTRTKDLGWHEWQNHHLGEWTLKHKYAYIWKHKEQHRLQVSWTQSELEINDVSATHRASRRRGGHSDPADLPQEPEPQQHRSDPDAPALQTREHRVTRHTRAAQNTHTHTHSSVIEPLRPSTACGSERRHMVRAEACASKHTGVYSEEQKIFS